MLAKVSGKTSTNVSHCTASTVLATSPTMADSHENASVKSRTMPAIWSQSVKLALLRKPITSPTTSITTVEMVLRSRSAATCPLSTRSMMPFVRSLLMPTAVMGEPKASVCTMMPGMRKLR